MPDLVKQAIGRKASTALALDRA